MRRWIIRGFRKNLAISGGLVSLERRSLDLISRKNLG